MEFLFHWSSWILSIVFILTKVMELDLMNHCACGIWTLELRFFSHILSCGYAKPRFALLSSTKVKFRRHKCRCIYYSNSMATFHLPLVGDLVFKLNPGPVINSTPRIASTLQNCNIHKNKSLLSSCSSLTMCLLNIRSLRNKTADFVDYVCETKVDLFAITETWLCPNDDAIRNESCPVGYVLADHSRTGRRGGGTALVYRNSLTVKKIDAGEKTSFEFSEWTVQSASHNLRIIVIYRPPYSDVHKVPMSTFFAEFADYVETILLSKEELLILGDFNIHIDVAGDSDANKLSDFFESVGLQQHVEQHTQAQGHTLDLVISRRSDNIIEDLPRVDRFLSDHGTVLFSLKSIKPSLLEKTISYRKLKSIDLNSLQSDLAATDLCRNPPEVLEDLARSYNSTLKVVLDKHAPLITRSIKVRPRVPWFNEEIKTAKRERRKAEKRWRRTRLDSDLAAFKVKRNAATALMNKARREFYTNFIEENSGDQKKLFAASNRLLNRGSADCLPPTIDRAQFAEDIGKFFIQKTVNIRSRLDCHSAVNYHKPDKEGIESSFVHLTEFKMLTEQDVKSLMQHSSPKSCALDPIAFNSGQPM